MNRLPDELLLFIFSQNELWKKDRMVFLDVCQRWRRVIGDRSLWHEKYLTEQEAARLFSVLPLDMPLRLEINKPGKIRRPVMRELLARATHVKWYNWTLMERYLAPNVMYSQLTHVHVWSRDPNQLAPLLDRLAGHLRVLFILSRRNDKNQPMDAFAASMDKCTQLTHLGLSDVNCRGGVPTGNMPHLMYFASYGSSLSTAAQLLFRNPPLLRYFYVDDPMGVAYFSLWEKMMDSHRLKGFSIGIHTPWPYFSPTHAQQAQQLEHHLKTHYPNAQQVELNINGRRAISYACTGWFDFDSIDEAK